MKARRASLVLIGRVERVEPDGKAETATRRLAVVQVKSILKGSLPGAGTPGAKPGVCNVLFVSPAAGKSGGDVDAMVVGGTGTPELRAGDEALIFLEGAPGSEGRFQVVAGTFGYTRLNAASEEGAREIRETLRRYREWCSRIEDSELRDALNAIYGKTLASLDARIR